MAAPKKTSRSKKTVSRTPSRSRVTQPMQEPYAMAAPAPVQQSAPGINNILVIILIILAFFGGYYYFKAQNLEKGGAAAGGTQQPGQQPAAAELKLDKKPSNDEPWRGNKDAQIVMVEYSDLECPFCKRIHPDLVKLFNDNNGEVAWVFRHYPLSFHPKAQKSAEATECVMQEQGSEGFWKMADAIYEKMPAMELTELPALAASVGANQATFTQCLDSDKTAAAVKADLDEGTKIGVQATPTTVFYNMKTGKSKTVEGAVPFDTLKQVLDEMKKG